MRFPVLLVVGVVCIVAGVGLAEWNRRHPVEKTAESVAAPAPVALTPEQLTASEPAPELPVDSNAVTTANAELAAQAKSVTLPAEVTVGKAKAVLGGSLFARNAVAQGNALFLVVEEGKQGALQTLVRLTADDVPRALIAHRPKVAAIAAATDTLYWAEGGAVYVIDASKGGVARGVILFPKARITSLTVGRDQVLAALVPKDVDPFSSDPVGAVVAISSTGSKTVIASGQIRLGDVVSDGSQVAWIAGYPAELHSAPVTGGAAQTLATRADGPLAIDGSGQLYFRHPVTGAPELQSVAIAGGEPRTVAKGEVDRLAVSGTDLWFSTAAELHGISTRGDHPRELGSLSGPLLELCATDDGVYALTRQEAGGHLLVRLPRSAPEGARP